LEIWECIIEVHGWFQGKGTSRNIGINKKPKAGRRRKVGARFFKKNNEKEVGKKKKGKKQNN